MRIKKAMEVTNYVLIHWLHNHCSVDHNCSLSIHHVFPQKSNFFFFLAKIKLKVKVKIILQNLKLVKVRLLGDQMRHTIP